MLPLFAVYAAEYMINQGFFELLYNQNTYIGTFCLDQATQYRWCVGGGWGVCVGVCVGV